MSREIKTTYPDDDDPRGYGDRLSTLEENAARAWRWGYIAARDDLAGNENLSPTKGSLMRASRRVIGHWFPPVEASWSWEQLLMDAQRKAFVAGTQWLASPPKELCEQEAA